MQKANEQTEKATAATNVMTIAQKKNTDGLIALTTETGEVKYVTEDMARAMLNGEAAMTDAANASGTAAGVISGNAANVNTSMTAIKAKTGEVNETVQTTTAKAVEQAQESTETSGGNLGEWLYNGFISKIEAWFPGATNKFKSHQQCSERRADTEGTGYREYCAEYCQWHERAVEGSWRKDRTDCRRP